MNKRLLAGDGKSDSAQVRAMISAIDKAAKRGTIHKNAAKRRKARLRKALSTSPSSA
jgi:ribosomal protein S20